MQGDGPAEAERAIANPIRTIAVIVIKRFMRHVLFTRVQLPREGDE